MFDPAGVAECRHSQQGYHDRRREANQPMEKIGVQHC
jgi:hypothetical protein